MARYQITAPDGNAYEVTAPDNASQDQVLAYAKANYKGAQVQGGMMGKLQGALGGIKNYAQQVGQLDASKWYRPALEMGGAALAGGAGSLTDPVTGPVGTLAGGALGLAGGKAAADAIDRFRGVQKPLSGFGEATKEAAGDVKMGVEGEMGGRAALGALGMVGKPLAKAAGIFGRVQGGVRMKAGENLFNNPEGFFMATGKYGKILGKIRNELGMLMKPSNAEIVDSEATVARRTAKQTLDQLDRVLNLEPGQQISAGQLLKGKQAMEKLIEKTPLVQRSQRKIMTEASNKLGDYILELAGPAERGAAKDYMKAAAGREFRKFWPVTKTGEPSIARPLVTGVAGTALQLPAFGGLGIAGAGAAYKGVNAAMQNPATRRMLWSQIVDALNNERSP